VLELVTRLVGLRVAREVPRRGNERGGQIVAMSVTVLPLERRLIVALNDAEHRLKLTLWITDKEKHTSK